MTVAVWALLLSPFIVALGVIVMKADRGCQFPRCVTQRQCRERCLAPVWEHLDGDRA